MLGYGPIKIYIASALTYPVGPTAAQTLPTRQESPPRPTRPSVWVGELGSFTTFVGGRTKVEKEERKGDGRESRVQSENGHHTKVHIKSTDSTCCKSGTERCVCLRVGSEVHQDCFYLFHFQQTTLYPTPSTTTCQRTL